MSEFYDGPGIDKFFAQVGGVVLPDEAYDTPQQRLVDLPNDEWGMGQPTSAHRDMSSEKTILDTFDPQLAFVTKQALLVCPFVMPVRGVSGQRQYILDIRQLRSLHLPLIDVDLDLSMESETFKRRQQFFGAVVVDIVTTRRYNEAHGYGDETILEKAYNFVDKVDNFLLANREILDKGGSVRVPSNVQCEIDAKFHVNVEKELNDILAPPETKEQSEQ